MDINLITRLIVALAYAIIAGLLFARHSQVSDRWKGFYLFASIVTVSWSAWYVALAFLNLSPDPWGILNRAGHLPIVAAFYVLQNTSKREQKFQEEVLASLS